VTVLGELALAFLLDSLLLAGFWAAVALLAAAAAVLGSGAGPLRFPALRGPAVAAFLAAMTAASLAHRFGAPDIGVSIGRRDVPLLWSLGAGATGAVASILLRRRQSARARITPAAAAPAGSRAGDGGPPRPGARTPR
jgi:hypothetical protein